MRYLKVGLFLFWGAPLVLRGHTYEEMRADLDGVNQSGKCVAAIARDLDISSSTLRAFLSGKAQTSPKVKAAYEKWKNSVESPLSEIKRTPIESDHLVAKKLDFSDVEEGGLESSSITASSKSPHVSEALEKAAICIPIRGDADDKDAKGIFYDHYVFQSTTNHLTKAIKPDSTTNAFPALESYGRTITTALPYGAGSSVLPVFAADIADEGLLVIPGRMREKEFDAARDAHETKLIRQALMRGQPILGICAGAWRVWHVLRQLEQNPNFDTVVPEGTVIVEDHGAPRMMSLSMSTHKVVYNIQMHGVTIVDDSLLAKIMGDIKDPLLVNSVHWKAVDATQSPKNVKISARSIDVNLPERQNRHGKVMSPQNDIAEAFETSVGSPIMGIQWHPEAYNANDEGSEPHLAILRWMAKAGDVYAQKRRVLKELKQKLKAL